MVDRKVVGISSICIVGMLGAAAWCFQYGNPTWHGLKVGYLLIIPACLAFATFLLLRRGRSFQDSASALTRWTKWRDELLVPYCIIVTALEAVLIVQSTRIALPLLPRNVGRLGIVLVSLLLVIAGNKLPKASLPLNNSRSRMPEQTERFWQIQGRLIVGMGTVFIVSACILTRYWTFAVIFGGTLVSAITIRVMKSRLLGQQQTKGWPF